MSCSSFVMDAMLLLFDGSTSWKRTHFFVMRSSPSGRMASAWSVMCMNCRCFLCFASTSTVSRFRIEGMSSKQSVMHTQSVGRPRGRSFDLISFA